MSQATRNLAIDLLDDQHGINRTGFKTLADMLYDEGHGDVIDAVNEIEGRYFLNEDTAEILRSVNPEH